MNLERHLDTLSVHPLHVRNLVIPSRFFLAPVNTGMAVGGEPTESLLSFHDQRSGRGIGISYVGNVSIGCDYVTNQSTPYFTSKNLDKWRQLTATIDRNGSVPGVQIGCRASSVSPQRKWKTSDRLSVIQTMQTDIQNLSDAFLEDMRQGFVDSARTAYEVGFKVVQVHAAHGYFLAQLLSPTLNLRTDKYSAANMLLLKEIITTIRANVPDVLLDIRLSLIDGLEDPDTELQFRSWQLGALASLDIDMVSISSGVYDVNKQLIYPPRQWGHGVYISRVLPLARQYPHLTWNVAGNIYDLRLLDGDLPSNLTFGIGRSLIADPEFVAKSLTNRVDCIRVCQRHGHCHYYSTGRESLVCPESPDLRPDNL